MNNSAECRVASVPALPVSFLTSIYLYIVIDWNELLETIVQYRTSFITQFDHQIAAGGKVNGANHGSWLGAIRPQAEADCLCRH